MSMTIQDLVEHRREVLAKALVDYLASPTPGRERYLEYRVEKFYEIPAGQRRRVLRRLRNAKR